MIFKKIFKSWFIGLLVFPVSLMAQNFTVSGTVKDGSNGETMISAMIYTADGNFGTATNVYGYYALEVPKGKHTLLFNYSGFKTLTKEIDVQGNLKLNVEFRRLIFLANYHLIFLVDS